ncbi:MAG: mechanosensitive ion channel family protein [Anaerolineae bacterium]|nr:mechanosensitive ion channel family protein [Anaerolineae bacterium]
MDAPHFLTDAIGADAALVTTRLAVALLILIALFPIRRINRWLSKRIIYFIDRAVERATKSELPLDIQLIKVFIKPLDLLLFTVGVWFALAVGLYALPGLSPIVPRVINAIGSSLVAAALFWTLFGITDVVAYYLSLSESRPAGVDDTIIRFLAGLGKIVIIVVAVIVIVQEWGYDLTGLITGLGLGTVAVSLAAQDSVANLIGYFAIMSDRPFEVGEYIVLDNVAGVVEDIGFRSTRIRQLDQSLVTVPNKTVAAATVTNWARVQKRRLNMTLNLRRDTPPDRVLSVVRDIRALLVNNQNAEADSVVVQFTDFGDNSLDIMVISMFRIADWAAFQAEKEKIIVEALRILEQHGVSLAIPQTMIVRDSALEATSFQDTAETGEADAYMAGNAEADPPPR